MKTKAISIMLLLIATMANAQAPADPIIMTINGEAVPRSEFEYSYNKNNTDGVIDKKTIEEYVDLFVNYKLKVQAAMNAKLDTIQSLMKEYASYRDQQIRPAMISDDDVEAKAREIYEQTRHRVDSAGGLVKPAHILIRMDQKATDKQQAEAKQRVDSLYDVLQKGGDFAELARKFSADRSGQNGGELGWIEKGYTVPEFEQVIYSMKPGDISKPFTTQFGWHIVKLIDKQNFFPYDSVHNNILRFIEQRGIRNQIINQKIEAACKATGKTEEQLLAEKRAEMEAADSDLKYLIKEYHDGVLAIELTQQKVWQKSQNDTEGLNKYFQKHKKEYKWQEPRFKGIAYRTRNVEDVKAVQKAIKKVPFDKWAQVLRETFNNDSILRIRVEKGYFKKGDNAIVDRDVFKKDTTVNELKDYPNIAVYGKLLKAPKALEDVKGAVTNDYSEYLMDLWVTELRKDAIIEVDKKVLATVNKH